MTYFVKILNKREFVQLNQTNFFQEIRNDIRDWLDKHCLKKYRIEISLDNECREIIDGVSFQDYEDATLFKMVWL